MSRTPSTEFPVALVPLVPEDGDGARDGDGTREHCPFCHDREEGCLRCKPPPWATEMLRLLRERLDRDTERLDRIEEHLKKLETYRKLDANNLSLLGNAYKVQAQEVQLLRQHCPHCPPDVISTSGD